MNPAEIDRALAQTLDDHRLSRTEKTALRAALADGGIDAERVALVRARAFQMAREALAQPSTPASVLDWLEDVVKTLYAAERDDRPSATVADALFSPGDGPLLRLCALMLHARHSVDACVFTITDDRISRAIEAAHHREVCVRIVTDHEKALDLGSDIERLARSGILVRKDRSAAHMHHKFCVIDGTTLVTGSYNWTRSAAQDNEENMLVTDDVRLVRPFAAAFERLWIAFE